MPRYFAELIAARWTFELDGEQVVARCDLHARSGHFFGEGRAESWLRLRRKPPTRRFAGGVGTSACPSGSAAVNAGSIRRRGFATR